MDPQPILTTDRLVLRPFRATDASDIQLLAGDRDVAATTLRIPHPYTDGLAEEWLTKQPRVYDAGEAVTFAITAQGEGNLIGAVGLAMDPQHERAELGYWIGKPFWGQGYATEAARAVVQYGFDRLRLERIHACYFAGNVSSGRVLQKVGMQHEGRLRRHIKKWGEFHDLEYYAVLRAPNEAVTGEDD